DLPTRPSLTVAIDPRRLAMDDAVAVGEVLDALVDDIRGVRRPLHHFGIDADAVVQRGHPCRIRRCGAATLGVGRRPHHQKTDKKHVLTHGLLLHTYCTRRAARARPSWPMRTSARTTPAADGISIWTTWPCSNRGNASAPGRTTNVDSAFVGGAGVAAV